MAVEVRQSLQPQQQYRPLLVVLTDAHQRLQHAIAMPQAERGVQHAVGGIGGGSGFHRSDVLDDEVEPPGWRAGAALGRMTGQPHAPLVIAIDADVVLGLKTHARFE
jgi:hypothetical protein